MKLIKGLAFGLPLSFATFAAFYALAKAVCR